MVPDGQMPHMASLSAYNELVDVSKLGDCLDCLVVMGIFRSVSMQVNPWHRMIKSLFKMFLDSTGPHKLRSHRAPPPPHQL
jgi:DNA replication licensing factor MCM4